jgi:hypothetical protein
MSQGEGGCAVIVIFEVGVECSLNVPAATGSLA